MTLSLRRKVRVEGSQHRIVRPRRAREFYRHLLFRCRQTDSLRKTKLWREFPETAWAKDVSAGYEGLPRLRSGFRLRIPTPVRENRASRGPRQTPARRLNFDARSSRKRDSHLLRKTEGEIV